MIDHFPKTYAKRAILIYFLALVITSVVFFKYALKIQWIIFGAVEVCAFFLVASRTPQNWSRLSDMRFEKKLFWTAFAIRCVYIIFSYIYYSAINGNPFEFGAADSFGYHSRAQWINLVWNTQNFKEYQNFINEGLSDCGYPTYLAVIYRLTGNSIIIARFIKALLGAYSCVLVSRLAARNFDTKTARLAGIFCMAMPNLIMYCGLHLKEVEMAFLLILFAERADYALNGGKIKIKPFIISIIAALTLFTFRTAVGAVAMMSIIVAAFLSSSKKMSFMKKVGVIAIVIVGLFISAGSIFVEESKALWEEKDTNQQNSMEYRAKRIGGNSFAAYASSSVFAPLIFTIPFPTIVETEGQENQRLINGGNYVKNITSFFVIFALFLMIFSDDWRSHVLPIAIMVGYLIVLAFSAFAQSERFHYPVLAFELMFTAYGITHINKAGHSLFKFWPFIILVAIVGWSWFKLAGRGIV